MSTEELINYFAEAAMARDAAMEQANSREANKHFDRMSAAFDELQRRGNAQYELIKLLNPEWPASVRSVAAAFVLRFSPKEAVSILEMLSSEQSLRGLEAKVTLLEWKKRN